MYFWRIEKLRDRLVARPLDEREVLPYLVVFVALTSVVGLIPQGSFNLWDYLGAGFGVFLAVFGTIWVYRQNGGAQGHQFLQRYLAISWVVAIRWLAASMVLFIPSYLLLWLYGIESETTTWYEAVCFAIAEVVFYWRLGVHVARVAGSAKPA